jgi:hypothetical protein
MKKILATLFGGIILFVILTYLSRDVYPTSSLYNFKRIYEKVNFILKPTPSEKAEYFTLLLDKRFDELQRVYIIDHFYILSSSLRYSTTAGEATKYIVDNNLTGNVLPLKRKFESHKKLAEKMAREYKGKGESASYIQDIANYADIYQNSLDEFCRNKNCTQ